MSTPYAENVPARSLPKGLAVASLVLGILGILTALFLVGGLLGLVAIILGLVALGKIKRGEADGRGLAIGGIVTGVIALLAVVALVAVGASFLSKNKDEINGYADCLKTANKDQAKVDACAREFNRQINP